LRVSKYLANQFYLCYLIKTNPPFINHLNHFFKTMSLIHLTDGNFKKEVLESDLPALVDFWAPWCGPCRIITPIIDELAKEYRNKLRICKLNVDENPRIATQYAVMSIPTLIFFKNGKVIEQVVRVLNKVELKRKIEENL